MSQRLFIIITKQNKVNASYQKIFQKVTPDPFREWQYKWQIIRLKCLKLVKKSILISNAPFSRDLEECIERSWDWCCSMSASILSVVPCTSDQQSGTFPSEYVDRCKHFHWPLQHSCQLFQLNTDTMSHNLNQYKESIFINDHSNS